MGINITNSDCALNNGSRVYQLMMIYARDNWSQKRFEKTITHKYSESKDTSQQTHPIFLEELSIYFS